MSCHFDYTGRVKQFSQSNFSNNCGPRSDTHSLCNSTCIKPLATSIHNDICQLYDQHTISYGKLSEQDEHSNRSHYRQMQKMLDKMNTLSRKVICLEAMLTNEANNKYPSSLQNYDIRKICNSTKSLINLTTSLRHDVIYKCQLRKPPSCHLANCNDVSATVEKIMLLENQLLELLSDAEYKLEREKYKLNVRVRASPLFRRRNVEPSTMLACNPAYAHHVCVGGTNYKEGSSYPQNICSEDQQHRYTEEYIPQNNFCQRKDFLIRKSNPCYSNCFDNEDDLCNRSDSFMLCKKPLYHERVCTKRKYKIKKAECPITEECLSVSKPRVLVCENKKYKLRNRKCQSPERCIPDPEPCVIVHKPCEQKRYKIQKIKCPKTDKCLPEPGPCVLVSKPCARQKCKTHPIKCHKFEKCIPDPELCVIESCDLTPEPCGRQKYKIQNIKCQKTIKCVPEPETCLPEPCDSFVKVTGGISCVTVDVRKSCSVARAPRKPKIKHICPQVTKRHICRSPCNVTSGMVDVRKSCSRTICPKIKTVKCKRLPTCRSYISVTKSEIPFVQKSRSCKEIRPKVKKYKREKCSCTSSHISIRKSQSSITQNVQRSASTVRKVRKIKSKTDRSHPSRTKSIISIYKSESVSSVATSTEISKSSQKWQFPLKVCKSKKQQKSCICVHKSRSSICAKCTVTPYQGRRKIRRKVYRSKQRFPFHKAKKVSVASPKSSVAVSTEDSSTQADMLITKSKTTGTLTDKVKYTNTTIQVMFEEDKSKIQTKDRGIDPVEELKPKPVKTRETSIATEPKEKPKKIDKGLDALDLLPKKTRVHFGVNVNTEDPPVKKQLTTTATDAHKPKMISTETQKGKTPSKHFGTNTDSVKVTEHSTNPIEFPVSEKKSKGTDTIRPKLIMTGTNTEITNTVDKNIFATPATDEKATYASLLQKPELKQAQTNTVQTKCSDKNTNTSKPVNVEKETNVNMKHECADKKTNTSKHEFAEKEVSAIIKIDYLDKSTSTLVKQQQEKEITAYIKGETLNKTTNTSIHKYEDKIINTDYIMQDPKQRQVEQLVKMKVEKPEKMYVQEVTQRQAEIELRSLKWIEEPKQIYEIKSDTREEKHRKNQVEIKHSTNRYLICSPKNKTYIYERSSIHNLSDGGYHENYDATLETEFTQSASDEYSTYKDYHTTDTSLPNTGKEYMSILEKKCSQLLKQYGRRLKNIQQTSTNTCSRVSDRDDKNRKKRIYELQKSPTPASSSNSDETEIYMLESEDSQAANEKSSSENIRNKDNTKTSSQNKKLKKININLQNNKHDNEQFETNNKENKINQDVSNINGKTIMHLSYSSRSSVQIVLPQGAQLYEEEEVDNQEENKKVTCKYKNNKRKKLNNEPNLEDDKNKEKCISKWMQIANKIRDTCKSAPNSSYFTLATSLNCKCQNSKSSSPDSSDTSTRSNINKNVKNK